MAFPMLFETDGSQKGCKMQKAGMAIRAPWAVGRQHVASAYWSAAQKSNLPSGICLLLHFAQQWSRQVLIAFCLAPASNLQFADAAQPPWPQEEAIFNVKEANSDRLSPYATLQPIRMRNPPGKRSSLKHALRYFVQKSLEQSLAFCSSCWYRKKSR